MLIGLKIFRPTAFLIVLWLVLSESYSGVSNVKRGVSNRSNHGNDRALLPKHARMMFSGIVEVSRQSRESRADHIRANYLNVCYIKRLSLGDGHYRNSQGKPEDGSVGWIYR
jgi:hypothetical protein